MKIQLLKLQSLFAAATLLTASAPGALAQSVLAEWNFNQPAGTSLAGIANDAGSQSSAGIKSGQYQFRCAQPARARALQYSCSLLTNSCSLARLN